MQIATKKILEEFPFSFSKYCFPYRNKLLMILFLTPCDVSNTTFMLFCASTEWKFLTGSATSHNLKQIMQCNCIYTKKYSTVYLNDSLGWIPFKFWVSIGIQYVTRCKFFKINQLPPSVDVFNASKALDSCPPPSATCDNSKCQ